MSTDLLQAALAFAARDWPVIPCAPGGKRPLTRHGYKDASTDAGQISEWWAEVPTANIGLVDRVNFDVLDIDGAESLEALQTRCPASDQGLLVLTVATPRGWHCYVAVTGEGNKTRLGGFTGVDWRGKGGHVVAPPSVKRDGGTWAWIQSAPSHFGPDTPIVPAPDWVLSLFNHRRISRILQRLQPGSPVELGTQHPCLTANLADL